MDQKGPLSVNVLWPLTIVEAFLIFDDAVDLYVGNC